MEKYIATATAFLLVLLTFAPIASAEGVSTPATATDAILADYATPSAPEVLDDGVIQMLTPATLDFIIDPFELLGLGEVFSHAYPLENLGSTDLEVIITDASATFSNDTDFEALEAPFELGTVSDKKAIYLALVFSGVDIPPIILTAPEKSGPLKLSLPAGGAPVLMRVSGSVNPRPAALWANGDVKIHLKYTINAVPPEDGPVATPATPAIATDPTVASPGNDGPWEPIGNDGSPDGPELDGPAEPEPVATPAIPAPPGMLPEESKPAATTGTLPEEPPPEPESPQPPEATSGVA